jgi:hypothetical protein
MCVYVCVCVCVCVCMCMCVCVISLAFDIFSSPRILLFSVACGKNHIELNCVDREATVLAVVLSC